MRRRSATRRTPSKRYRASWQKRSAGWRMDAAAEAGITVALELGPGAALAHAAKPPSHINTRSVADFRTLDGIHKWLERASES
jgi:hypothetical protein